MVEVGLPSTDAFFNSYPHQMSGGQQQRVAIAMAFSCRPRVIVLDEPTTGLDVTTQRRVLDTVRELTTEHNVTSVYVSHDLTVVAQLADQTAVLYAGRLVEHASTEAIFRGARHPYTVGLLKAVPSPARSEILVGIEGRPPRPGRDGRWLPSPTGARRWSSSVVGNCRFCTIWVTPNPTRCGAGRSRRCRSTTPNNGAGSAPGIPGRYDRATSLRAWTSRGSARHHVRRRKGPLHCGGRPIRVG
jgi:peptide/nickel transport system ATP-binding protein